MLFNSFPFIAVFLPVSLLVYFWLNRLRLVLAADSWLLAASVFFYGWWDIRYVPLLLGSILFNYTIGSLLTVQEGKQPKFSRSVVFLTGISVNLLVLGYFKYADFFLGSINAVSGSSLPLLKLVLPLGISFFTITQIAFLVDSYEGLAEERNLLHYGLFVTFFPHLLAGPILHHKDMMPQFGQLRNKVLNYRNLSTGLFLFMLGMFKKVVIADTVGPLANEGFLNSATITLIDAWVASLAYTTQLYFDFSGYSDMALGVAWMFNIRLPANFNSPYKATSIIDFWKRWHMTLTNFITTYVYTPIVRSFSRVTFSVSLAAIFLSMLVSGFWHGAGWTYVLWGGLHGFTLVLNHWWRKKKIKMPQAVGWLLTFGFVNFSMVLFRAKDMGEAWRMLWAMSGCNGVILPISWQKLVPALADYGVTWGKMFGAINGHGDVAVVFVALAVAFFFKFNSLRYAEPTQFQPSRLNQVLLIGMILINLLFLNSIRAKEFLYFGF